jgi:hypothetical protein
VSETTIHNCSRELIRRGDVYVGRRSKSLAGQEIEGWDGRFGNPFIIRGKEVHRNKAVENYERYARDRIVRDPEWCNQVKGLHGRRLFCWCAPKRCHAEVLATIAAELHRQDALADQPEIDDGVDD